MSYKAECPNKAQYSDSSKSASANLAQTTPEVFSQVPETLEVISEPEDEDSQEAFSFASGKFFLTFSTILSISWVKKLSL